MKLKCCGGDSIYITVKIMTKTANLDFYRASSGTHVLIISEAEGDHFDWFIMGDWQP